MADLSDKDSAQSVKLVGANSTTGIETNYVDATANGIKVDGSAVTQPVSQATSPWEVAGNVASGATDSGNPVRGAGKYNTTLPTYSDGQRAGLQSSSRGELLVGEFNSHTRISGATTVTVKSGTGLLRRVVINRPTNGTATVYDNTTATGSPIMVIAYSNATAPSTLEYGFTFTTGLTIVTTGANTDISILYL